MEWASSSPKYYYHLSMQSSVPSQRTISGESLHFSQVNLFSSITREPQNRFQV